MLRLGASADNAQAQAAACHQVGVLRVEVLVQQRQAPCARQLRAEASRVLRSVHPGAGEHHG